MGTTKIADAGDIEDCIIRYEDLGSRKSSYRPIDMVLPRFDRERYSVVGRGSEGTSKAKRTGDVEAFSIVYLKIASGNGVGAHAHATPEVFIPMSGIWEVEMEGRKTNVEPWDVIAVPPGVMHGLTNVGKTDAVIMAINGGHAGVPIYFEPALLDEIKRAGGNVREVDYPPGSAPAKAG